MTNNTKLDAKLEGAKKFKAWKYQIMLILEENDLGGFIKEEVAEPEGDEAKAKHKKYMINAKRCLVAQMSYFHPIFPSLFLTLIPIHQSINHSLCHFHK